VVNDRIHGLHFEHPLAVKPDGSHLPFSPSHRRQRFPEYS
jgi:hypothetical protein